jgi:hypothetical protein
LIAQRKAQGLDVTQQKETKEQEKVDEEEDDPMAAFMAELAAAEQSAAQQSETGGDRDNTDGNETSKDQVQEDPAKRFVDHDAETAGWTGANQIDRLLRPHYSFWNANPFEALGITNEHASEEDVRKRFLKLSALVHPDKNRQDQRSNDAFQEVKKAYEKLKLEGFEKVRPAFEKQAESMRGYTTNTYHHDSRIISEIARRWRPFIQRYGYEQPVADSPG